MRRRRQGCGPPDPPCPAGVAEVLQVLADDDRLVAKRKEQEKDARAESALFLETKPLAKTAVANLLEFGRIVHAEMAAICDAAARGYRSAGARFIVLPFHAACVRGSYS